MDRIDYSLIAGADDTGEPEPNFCICCNEEIEQDQTICDYCKGENELNPE